MGLGILYDDLSLAATITGTATAGDGPLSNLQDPQPRHRARVNSTGAFIILDLLAPRSIDVAGLASTNQLASSTFLLRMSATDPSVTGSLVHDSGFLSNLTQPGWNGNVWRVLSSPVTARYVRWDIIASAAPIDIGLAPCGLLARPARMFTWGNTRGFADGGVRDVNGRTGAHFGLDGARPRFRQFVLPRLTRAEADGFLRTMDRDLGLARDVLFIPDLAAAAADLNADSIWGAWKASPADGTAHRTLHQHGRSFSLLERF